MLGFFKRRLFNEMNRYVDIIIVSLCEELLRTLKARRGEEKARRLAAAAVNKLLARPASSHSEKEVRAAEPIARKLMLENEEARYAVLTRISHKPSSKKPPTLA